jgi:hypothetical protein
MAIAAGLGLLVLFSLISFVLRDDDRRARDAQLDELLPYLAFYRH